MCLRPWLVESAATGIFMCMARTSSSRSDVSSSGSNNLKHPSTKDQPHRHASISVYISFIIILIGGIQLVSTFHTYAINLTELNSLKTQQAALLVQKQQLENDIARWDDPAYVTAQARERLGFVFPGEQAIRVLHPEAVTGGESGQSDKMKALENKQMHSSLPWYKEMAYSLEKADMPPAGSNGSSNTESSERPTAGNKHNEMQGKSNGGR